MLPVETREILAGSAKGVKRSGKIGSSEAKGLRYPPPNSPIRRERLRNAPKLLSLDNSFPAFKPRFGRSDNLNAVADTVTSHSQVSGEEWKSARHTMVTKRVSKARSGHPHHTRWRLELEQR